MLLNRISICSAVTALLFSTPLFAEETSHFHPHQVEGILGSSTGSHSLSHINMFADEFTEIDTLDSKDNETNFTWGVAYAYNILPLFTAYQHPRENDIVQHVLLGLDWIFLNNTDTGEVLQFGQADQNNFTYDFRVVTSRIMLNSEIDFLSPWKPVFPFLQISAGGASIQASYKDTPNDPDVGGGLELDERINYNLVWSLGAGVKFLVIPTFQISASYLFTDFGLVKAQDDIITDRFYTNSAFFGFSYLFG